MSQIPPDSVSYTTILVTGGFWALFFAIPAVTWGVQTLRARRRRAPVVDIRLHRAMREHPSNVRVMRKDAR